MPTPSEVPTVTYEDQRLVRMAARALGRSGLAHAYGHCSLRLDEHYFLVCAPEPMGLIRPDDQGTIVAINGELPEGVLGEVRIHQQIYSRRPDVQGIARSMPRDLMTLSAAGKTPLPRHGIGSYFYPNVPLWDDVQLVRTDAQACKVAETIGEGRAVVMKGNGVVVVSDSLQKAVGLTWYLEDAARIELALRAAGLANEQPTLSEEAAEQRATSAGRIFERMWDYLVAGDDEL